MIEHGAARKSRAAEGAARTPANRTETDQYMADIEQAMKLSECASPFHSNA